MASTEDERRWRKALKKLGLVHVRRRLQQPDGDDTAESETSGIVSDAPHPPRRFVDSWYRNSQQQRQRAKHVRSSVLTVLVLVIIAVGILFLMVH